MGYKMKKAYKSLITTLIFAFSLTIVNQVKAKQSTNASPWGYTGLINMPTADVLSTGEFYLSGSYLFKNPGFTGNGYIGIFDRLELGVVGGFPSESFTGLAGNIKYQLIKPTAQNPTGLAAGINLLGINLIGTSKSNPLITGNSLYMVASHDFNWILANKSIYNLCSGHIGFGGNLEGARLMLGIDIPVTDYINLEGEYLGKIGNFNDMINFGIKGKPFSFLSVSILTIGTSTARGFDNTEFILNVAFNAKIPAFQTASEDKALPTATPDRVVQEPKPGPTPEITVRPERTPAPVISPEPQPSVTPAAVISSPANQVTPMPTPEASPVVNSGSLHGKITGISGGKVPQQVKVSIKGLKGSYTDKVATDNDGSFKFSEIPPGEYILILEKEGYQEARRQLLIKPGDITESVIEMIATNGSVSGRVIDPKGNPLSGITLALDKNKKIVTTNDGKFSFADLGIGFHVLSVFRDSQELKSLDVDITAGVELKKEIVLDIEPKKEVVPNKNPVVEPDAQKEPVVNKNSTIIGKITSKTEQLKGAQIMMEGDKLTVMTISGLDGKYIVKNLPAGNYKMTVSKAGFATRIFSVKIKEGQEARHDVELKAN
jgi:hypothetical protein